TGPGPNAPNVLQEEANVMLSIPGYVPLLIARTTLSVLMDAVLIVSGIGLLRLRPWGRWAAVAWAVYTIPTTLAWAVYMLTVYSPAMSAWIEDFSRKSGSVVSGDMSANTVLMLVVPLFLVGYAVALLVVLFRPGVSAALAGRADHPPRDREVKEDEEGPDAEPQPGPSPPRTTDPHAPPHRQPRPGAGAGAGRGPAARRGAGRGADRGRRVGRERRADVPRSRRAVGGAPRRGGGDADRLPPRPG